MRKIRTYGGYFEEFMNTLTGKEQEKIQYILLLLKTQDRMPVKFVKFIRDGLYELRIEYNSNIYRVFFIFDEDYIVVLFNGFQKKTPKTPTNEIEKALKIKKNIMQTNNHKIVDYDAVLDTKFGKEGTPERIEAEEKAFAFYTGKIIENARKQAHISQAELAKRIGTDRAYVSRIEVGK